MAGIAIFDADGTLHEGFSIFPLYEVFADEGFLPRQDSDRLQEVLGLYNNNDIDYRTFVVDTLQVAADVLKGRKVKVASTIAETFFNDPGFKWFGYVKPLMTEFGKSDVGSILLTAEPQFIAAGISSALNFKERHSSQFGVDNDGRFAGNVLSALGSSQKGEITRQVVTRAAKSIAFGDSEGDIGMLELVDAAACILPTEGLRDHAVLRGWTIIDDPEQPDIGVQFAQAVL